MPQPFRWDITKREQLGRLVDGPRAKTYPGFFEHLQACCSRVIAFCDDSDLVFVGRSPESIFDHLSGLLADTSWASRCSLLNISMRVSPAEIRHHRPRAIFAVREQFDSLGLSPLQIIARDQPVALVDLVWYGRTLGSITQLLVDWVRELHGDEAALREKLRFVGITPKKKTSPETWRWQQHVEWTQDFRTRRIKNVSIPLTLYVFLLAAQPKVAQTNPPWRWGDEAMAEPLRDEENLQALRLALHLYETGCERDTRLEFATRLSAEPAMKHAWFRSLIIELRGAV
jgi:hypothetical protein